MIIGYESIDTLIKFIAFERFKIEIYSDFRQFQFNSIYFLCLPSTFKRVAFELSLHFPSGRKYASIKFTLFKRKQFNSWAACRISVRYHEILVLHCAKKEAFPSSTRLIEVKHSTQVEKGTEEQHLTTTNNNIHNYLFGPLFVWILRLPLCEHNFSCMPFDLRSHHKTSSQITILYKQKGFFPRFF